MVLKNGILWKKFLLLGRHAILTGANILHKGIQEKIAGGYKFKVKCIMHK